MDLTKIFIEKIQKTNIFQPVLFLWNNKVKLDLEIDNIISSLFSYFEVDKNNIYTLKDNWETIKIEEIRNFILKANIKSNYKFQIFLIENISRLTLQSSNACLKFLEEPGEWNIIFLSNLWESQILDTILSRVVKINLYGDIIDKKDEFYYSMIKWFLNKDDLSLLYYFFDDKNKEKEDYKKFFNTFLFFIKENKVLIEFVDDIEKNIQLLEKWSISPKYLFDNFISKLI